MNTYTSSSLLAFLFGPTEDYKHVSISCYFAILILHAISYGETMKANNLRMNQRLRNHINHFDEKVGFALATLHRLNTVQLFLARWWGSLIRNWSDDQDPWHNWWVGVGPEHWWYGNAGSASNQSDLYFNPSNPSTFGSGPTMSSFCGASLLRQSARCYHFPMAR